MPTSIAVHGDARLRAQRRRRRERRPASRSADGRLDAERRHARASPAPTPRRSASRRTAPRSSSPTARRTRSSRCRSTPAARPPRHPSSGATPYGFDFTRDGTLVVTEAFGGDRRRGRRVLVRRRRLEPVSKQRREHAQRGLLGRRDEGRPLRLRDELRRRHDLELRDRRRRLARARSTPVAGSTATRREGRPRRGALRGRPLPLRARRRRAQGLRVRRAATTAGSTRSATSTACPQTAAGLAAV